jgi:hypothetical protein
MIKQGFQLTSLQSDDRFLMSRAKEEVEAVRNALQNANKEENHDISR